MGEVVENPHVLARGMVIEVDSPIGRVRQIGIAPKLSDTPGHVRSSAPTPGQHTDQILQELGYDRTEIARLRERGAIG